MATILPMDDNNNPIPALRLRNDAAHTIAAGTTSARNTNQFAVDTQIVSVFATVPVYLRFGDTAVNATTTDHYFPAGIYYDFAIGGEGAVKHTNLAVLRADTTSGSVYVSEKI